MFKTKGGWGVNGRLNNVQKNCRFGVGWHPLLGQKLRQKSKYLKTSPKTKQMYVPVLILDDRSLTNAK